MESTKTNHTLSFHGVSEDAAIAYIYTAFDKQKHFLKTFRNISEGEGKIYLRGHVRGVVV